MNAVFIFCFNLCMISLLIWFYLREMIEAANVLVVESLICIFLAIYSIKIIRDFKKISNRIDKCFCVLFYAEIFSLFIYLLYIYLHMKMNWNISTSYGFIPYGIVTVLYFVKYFKEYKNNAYF